MVFLTFDIHVYLHLEKGFYEGIPSPLHIPLKYIVLKENSFSESQSRDFL